VKGAAANRTAADAFAANLLPIVRHIQAAGATTSWGIAEALNARGVRTRAGRGLVRFDGAEFARAGRGRLTPRVQANLEKAALMASRHQKSRVPQQT
jgi:hypothetical protein